MFDNKEKFNIKKEENNNKTGKSFSDLSMQDESGELPVDYSGRLGSNIKIIAAFVFILILALGIFSYFVFIKKDTGHDPVKAPVGQNGNINNNSAGILPDILSGNGNGDEENADVPEDLKAEDLSFGNFYEKQEEDYAYSESLALDLPMNVKTDVSNYYYISRKINLDSGVNQLNQEGFAVFDNPFSGKNKKISADSQQADDFYSMYGLLSGKEVPILITSDFLIYYYQNVLKQVYEDIQKDVFYDDLWQISRNFYEISNNKYRELRKKEGMANNVITEGQRLETAYFAVVLELLKPKSDQISEEPDDNKFSAINANEFEFNLPAYLKDDVKNEIDLIIGAKGKSKSPVFLYHRDYAEFEIPKNYKNNAKLKNFYLAAKWMNSVFPLHYKNEECRNCLLDKDDWKINMITACLITQDFFDNQELKNQWAKIYKIASFFSGLRGGLTYLHYQDALIDFFGKDYQVNVIFSPDNPNSEENLLKFAERIAKYEFSSIEGGMDRKDSLNLHHFGMRMLQEPYWPDDYIFSQLKNPMTGSYLSDVKDFEMEINLTNCKEEHPSERCNGFGLDIINLVYPIGEDNAYFKENTNYQNYCGKSADLRNQLKYFNVDSWHNNNFWTTLSIVKSFLDTDDKSRHPYVSDNWQNKNINSSLAAWVNLRLPADELVSGWKKEGGNLGMVKVNSDYDYVEPDIELINELIANSNMLLRALTALEVIQNSNFTYNKLNKLISELENMKRIVIKELNNEILDYDELEIINTFAKQFIVFNSMGKDIVLQFSNSKRIITESIEGVKLLILTYNYNNKKVFAVGPIFNYQEK